MGHPAPMFVAMGSERESRSSLIYPMDTRVSGLDVTPVRSEEQLQVLRLRFAQDDTVVAREKSIQERWQTMKRICYFTWITGLRSGWAGSLMILPPCMTKATRSMTVMSESGSPWTATMSA